MKNIFLIAAVLYFTVSHSQTKNTNGSTANGYTSLFDGQSLKGWHTYQNKEADSWSVKDGTLYCKPGGSGKRSDLVTEAEYENFDLSFDWKIAPKGNSGVLYMVNEAYPQAHVSGPEYQLIDDVGYSGKLEDWQKTGANYAMHTAPNAHPKPAGEWNNTRIVVNKGHVEHWLNGEKIVDYNLWTEDWKKRKEEGKWKDTPNYGMTKKGRIVLQDHGSEAWFKNVRIKEL